MLKVKFPLPFFIFLLMQLVIIEACLKYNPDTKRCQQCPLGTHMYKGNCLYDINQCLEYHNGADCKKCEKGYKIVKNRDWIQCRKLDFQQKGYYLLQEIDPTLPQNQNLSDIQYFYSFLNSYLIKKCHEDKIQCQLVKVVDKLYKTGQKQAFMFYKTSEGNMEKITVRIIGNYTSFQLLEIVLASPSDISDDQIVFFDEKDPKKYVPLNTKVKGSNDSIPVQQVTTQKQQNREEIREELDFNYLSLEPENRQNDIGFQASNQFLKQNNIKILGEESKVILCFVKKSGLRKNYKISYETSSKEIYVGQVIYDIVKGRTYILNFGKQFSI